MRAFFAWLATFFANNNRSWIAQILTGAGLGLASMAAFGVFLDYYKNLALSNLGNLGAVAGLLGIGGVDKSISIVLGAYFASLYIKQFAAGLRVIKK